FFFLFFLFFFFFFFFVGCVCWVGGGVCVGCGGGGVCWLVVWGGGGVGCVWGGGWVWGCVFFGFGCLVCAVLLLGSGAGSVPLRCFVGVFLGLFGDVWFADLFGVFIFNEFFCLILHPESLVVFAVNIHKIIVNVLIPVPYF
ncbi:hypothetical protein, partial [Yersinia mollaretii]|uniref:hypothetical protein n=1 Tax=Yersinia mollaretii TaxID=33060 RepID=UPI001C941238